MAIRDGVSPELLEKVDKVLAAMSALGHPMRICQGVRTVAQQQALYAQGRTLPGKIVTNADGVVKLSNHQGGRAVDCCFTTGDAFGEHQPWSAYGECGKSVGLKWGGNFLSIRDLPHLELPA